MSNNDLKALVARFAPTPGSIWPNGLGFNWRGWEYSYGVRGWSAIRGEKLGYGETPLQARANATEIPIYVS